MNYDTLKVRVHSRLADLGRRGWVGYIMWLLVRASDTKGAGCVWVSVAELAEYFGIKENAVIRRFYTARDKGFFTEAYVKDGRMKVRYKSAEKLAYLHGITSFGAIDEVDFKVVNSVQKLISFVTHSEAKRLQEQSFYAASKAAKKHDSDTYGQTPVCLEELAIFTPVGKLSSGRSKPVKKQKSEVSNKQQSSDNLAGNYKLIRYVTDTAVFVGSDFLLYGASQAGVAIKMGRQERTARRRLNLEQNCFTDLDRSSIKEKRRVLCKLTDESTSMYEEGDIVNNPRVFKYCGETYKSYCNIYMPYESTSISLSCRSLRNRLRKLWRSTGN